jgi:hypothetical protein
VGKQYLGSVGKIDRGVVTVTPCWADERVYYAVHACPYTPAHHFPRGKSDLGFRTKLQIAADLAARVGDRLGHPHRRRAGHPPPAQQRVGVRPAPGRQPHEISGPDGERLS